MRSSRSNVFATFTAFNCSIQKTVYQTAFPNSGGVKRIGLFLLECLLSHALLQMRKIRTKNKKKKRRVKKKGSCISLLGRSHNTTLVYAYVDMPIYPCIHWFYFLYLCLSLKYLPCRHFAQVGKSVVKDVSCSFSLEICTSILNCIYLKSTYLYVCVSICIRACFRSAKKWH